MRGNLFQKKQLYAPICVALLVMSASDAYGYKKAEHRIVDNYLEQQEGNITGKVIDSSGIALVGATVYIKGSTQGTITAIDGTYSLKAENGDVLVFQYIGCKTVEVTVGAQSSINVTLKEDALGVDEVVVVGYGTQRKSDITGSVAVVGKDRLAKIPVTNVLSAIQGSVPGISVTQSSSIPGDAPSVQVRGQNSLSASNSPYVVVDGIPISKTGGSIADINPNDIESIQFLKDASSTAIYGTNGANGVILVTTKRGKSSEPTVRYSGYVGFEDFSNRLEMADGATVLQAYKDYNAVNPSSPMFNEFVKYEAEMESYEKGIETDWIDAISRTGVIQNHNVGVSGGADNVQYYMSADVADQKGILQGYDYSRYSYRVNLDMNVTDYLKIGTSSYIASHNRDGGRANLINAIAMSPYGDMYNDDGTYRYYPMYNELLWANPLSSTTADYERRQWNINTNGYAEVDFGNIYKPLKGLKYKFNGGYTFDQKRDNSYTGESVNDQYGTASISNTETQSYTIENIVTYNRDFGKHHFDFTGLYAAFSNTYQKSSANGEQFINDELLWNNIGSAETPSVSSYKSKYTTLSQMGRINYNFDNKYLFTFTVRRDGSSVFGANSKYGVFPSVALGWNLARESFVYDNADWINNLKLRASVGQSGNEAISSYTTLSKLNSGKIVMNGSSLSYLGISSVMGNADLSWETTLNYNLGLDFAFLNNRINGSVETYLSYTTDLLLSRSLPAISGFSSVYSNMGKVQNKGIEFNVNGRIISKTDFSWGVNFNVSLNRNKILDLYGDGKDDLGNGWFIGEPITDIYNYTYEGIWQTDEIEAGMHLKQDPLAKAGDVKLADINGDGQITSDDKKVIGDYSPSWTGGMTNTFTYKNLSLSVFLQTVQGAYAYNSLLANVDGAGRSNYPAVLSYWTPDNPTNEWRSLSTTSNRHGYSYYCDASYVRVKDITMSYNVPKKITDKINLGGLTAYVSGRNLFTFTDWIGWDPEARYDGRGSGSWESNYPYTKSFVFGLNVTF